MPTCICTSCGRVGSWRNRRGFKLSDYSCVGCGQHSLAAATYNAETQTWVKRDGKVQKPQGPLVICVICGRRGRSLGWRFFRKNQDRTYQLNDYERLRYGRDSIGPGEPCCTWHITEAIAADQRASAT